jgi:hypothetical protein
MSGGLPSGAILQARANAKPRRVRWWYVAAIDQVVSSIEKSVKGVDTL